MYIRLCPEAFKDENQQIMWAMSFIKSGHANHLAECIFASEDAQGLPFMDWMDFEATFQRNFTLLNSDSAAVNKLEGNSYFQKERSVDDYINEFRDLIHKSRYVDPQNIVVKFCRGLNQQISLAISGMAIGRPSDVKPEHWYELATQLDQNSDQYVCISDNSVQRLFSLL